MGGTATLPSEPCTAAWPRTGEIARGELAWNARSHRRWLRRLGPVVAVLLLGATAVLTTGLQGRSQLLLADLPPSPVEPGTSVSGGDVGRVIPAEIVYTQASELSDEDCQMEVAPVGSPVNLIWENAAAHGQTGLRLQNYREVAQSLDGFEGLLPVVIGEYSSSTVDMGVDGVSYVPLGA